MGKGCPVRLGRRRKASRRRMGYYSPLLLQCIQDLLNRFVGILLAPEREFRVTAEKRRPNQSLQCITIFSCYGRGRILTKLHRYEKIAESVTQILILRMTKNGGSHVRSNVSQVMLSYQQASKRSYRKETLQSRGQVACVS